MQEMEKTLSDDIESFFWATFHFAIRFLRSNLEDAQVPQFMRLLFGPGSDKSHIMQIDESQGILIHDQQLLFSSPMEDLLSNLLSRFRILYRVRQGDTGAPITDDDRAVARSMTRHKYMGTLTHSAFTSGKWPYDDVAGDRMEEEMEKERRERLERRCWWKLEAKRRRAKARRSVSSERVDEASCEGANQLQA